MTEGQVARQKMPARVVHLFKALDAFLEASSATEQLVTELAPHAAKLDSPEAVLQDFTSEMRNIPDEARATINKYVKSRKGERIAIADVIDLLHRRYPNQLWLYRLMGEFNKIRRRNRRAEVLNRSFVTSIVGSFEVLLSEVQGYYYSAHPDAFANASDEKEFSLYDLQRIGDIEEARQSIVNKRIEKFLYGSFSDWSSWWQKKLGFGFDSICMSWPDLVEIVERRHIIVHNGGRVSQRYRTNLKITDETPAVGTELQVDEEYVLSALTEMRVLGILLATLTVIKLDVTSAPLAVTRINDGLYDFMLNGEWRPALSMSQAGLQLKASADDQLIFQVNEWLCQKRLGNDISADVRKVDTSIMQSVYKCVLATLCDDIDGAFENMEECIKNDSITLKALIEWPVLDELRPDPRFRELLMQTYKSASVHDPTKARELSEVLMDGQSNKFHGPKCRYAREGAIPILKRTALQMSLIPCGSCKP